MSIRAHRITKFEYAPLSSWNLSHDDKLGNFFENKWIEYLNQDGAGMVYIPIKTAEQAVANANNLALGEKTLAMLKADIAAAKKEGGSCIQYYCG